METTLIIKQDDSCKLTMLNIHRDISGSLSVSDELAPADNVKLQPDNFLEIIESVAEMLRSGKVESVPVFTVFNELRDATRPGDTWKYSELTGKAVFIFALQIKKEFLTQRAGVFNIDPYRNSVKYRGPVKQNSTGGI